MRYWVENSRRATYVQQRYAIDNPNGFSGYGRNCWGITASDGPGSETIMTGGKKYQFFDYKGRGVPYGPNDGTISPWAVVASLPFAPEIVLPAIYYLVNDLAMENIVIKWKGYKHDKQKQKDHMDNWSFYSFS